MYKQYQYNTPNNYVSICGNLQQLTHSCIDLNYIQHQTKYPTFAFGVMLYKKDKKKIDHLLLSFCSSTYVDLYMLGKKEEPTLYFSLSWEQIFFYSQLWPRMIANNYVITMVIYQFFIDYGISEINCRHLMFGLRKDKYILIYKELQFNITNTHVSIFGNLQQFSNWFIDWSYSQHQMSASYSIFGGIFYTRKTRK